MSEISSSSRARDAAPVDVLQAALDRERARVREVDHRAKNSLQVVSSLLLLQSRRSAQPETQAALKAMHQRVAAIAAMHREILDAERPNRFGLSQFLREHLAALARSHDGARVHLDLDPVELDAARACPVALIVNELALNALTHGVATGCEPTVDVVLRSDGEGFVLSVQDQGAGLPPTAAQAGFGLTIVKLMAQQLGGSVAFEDAQPGLRAVVTAK